MKIRVNKKKIQRILRIMNTIGDGFTYDEVSDCLFQDGERKWAGFYQDFAKYWHASIPELMKCDIGIEALLKPFDVDYSLKVSNILYGATPIALEVA